ncbi:innexin unc-9-like isoform X2 [Convolutriloba macropyga]|uniref:innexin unc-9-like isoform X2 n=1 Tax=Convolutriloba macropyga TaxID=536237 RepID=UPI003F52537C
MIAHILKALISVQTASDGDWVDRLNHRFTAMILVVLGILVSTKQYVGDPINCWTPAQFNREWVEYTNNICWISNTYYLPFETAVADGKKDGKILHIKYYQWVPIILALQGLLFYIPRTVWRAFCVAAGIDIDKIVNTATTFESVLNPDLWTKTVRYLAKHYDRYLDAQRDIGHGAIARIRLLASRLFCVCSRRYGNYLNVFYIFTKFLYLFNVFGQLFLLGHWLGDGYQTYGLTVAKKIFEGKDWTEDGRFARVTLCDFEVRQVGANVEYTVQCVLSINLFNEKIYLFVWYWLVFVAIATSINTVQWIIRTICLADRMGYIKKHLKFMDRYNSMEDRKMVRRFVNIYLRPDGVFMIRLLSKNTNSIIVSELVAQLWDQYLKKPDHSQNVHSKGNQNNMNTNQSNNLTHGSTNPNSKQAELAKMGRHHPSSQSHNPHHPSHHPLSNNTTANNNNHYNHIPENVYHRKTFSDHDDGIVDV